MDESDYQPIENYGVIGNLQTVALVGINGSIDFLSFPLFDSPTIFAALLDKHKGGQFQLAPCFQNPHHKQLYFSDSNILLTRFLSNEGVAEVSDFMPIAIEGDHRPEAPHVLIRRAKCVRGEVTFRMKCAPKFDYGRAGHTIERISEHELLFHSEPKSRQHRTHEHRHLSLRLFSDVNITHQNGIGHAHFTLRSGETVFFILEEAHPHHSCSCQNHDDVSEKFKQTLNYWRNWIGHSTYRGRWRESVDRSALVLKLLTSQKYGSIVAAPTFGLPEVIGEGRNWDYRYTWIRDASFTLYSLNRLGFNLEASAFMDWLEARCAELPDGGALQIMYGIDGRKRLTEHVLPHFEGYMGSRPVRIGNSAYKQLQLDIYGELMDSVYLYNKYGQPISHDLWKDLTKLLNWVCENWNRPDEGIWEVRAGGQHYLYSRLMCWVAIDRGIRLASKRSFPSPLAKWITVRDKIYTDIYENFWNPKKKWFSQTLGSDAIDASSLLMPLVKFVGPTDRRWLSHLEGITRELVDDSLVYRYRTPDGLCGVEGTFCMCSFWYVECISRSGDVAQARFLFEKMLGYANHLGLYAEELGPAGEFLGNFPQAFTHLALISAAYDIDRRLTQAGAKT